MKTKHLLLAAIGVVALFSATAQNTFPSVGNTGIGTVAPVTTLQVIGTSRMGATNNFAQFGANGNLSFKGNAKYLVADNSYVFQMNSNNQYGLYFNSTLGNYEFKNGFGTPVFLVDVNLGDGEFLGGLKIGNTASAIPGNIRWSGTDFEGYDGNAWKSFTASPTTGANTALSNLASTAVNVNLVPGLDNTRDLGSQGNSWRNAYIDGAYYLQGFRFINAKDQNVFVGRSTGANITTGINNSFLGSQSGTSTNSGSNNTFGGYLAGNKNTTGSFGTFYGSMAGTNNLNGTNSFFGYRTGFTNTSGSSNAFFGSNTGFSNSTGFYNSFFGEQAGFGNTTGNANSFVGRSAGSNNTTGSNNVLVGAYTGRNIVAGQFNTYVGSLAGDEGGDGSENNYFGYMSGASSSGTKNCFFGNESGKENLGSSNSYYGYQTGSLLCSNSLNSFFGSQAGFKNIGQSNSFFGAGSGNSNTSGGFNCFFGSGTGTDNSSGNGNAFFGNGAGQTNITGNNNTCIGNLSDVQGSGYSNATAIGYAAIVTASNSVMLGNTSVTEVKAAGNIVIVSDGRFKKNIKANVPGLEFINALQPVTYNYDVTSLNNFISPDNKRTEENSKQVQTDNTAIVAKEKMVYSGFVAQEVEKVANKLNYDFSGVYKPKNDKDPYGLSYAEFVVPLVKAVQELDRNQIKNAENVEDAIAALQNENKELKQQNIVQQKQIDIILQKLTELQNAQQNSEKTVAVPANSNNIQSVILTNDAALEQNIPNPFPNTTTIIYTLPSKYTTAQIVITDKSGKTIKAINISGNGKGKLNLDAAALTNGTYSYTLYVDRKLISSKQMIIAK